MKKTIVSPSGDCPAAQPDESAGPSLVTNIFPAKMSEEDRALLNALPEADKRIKTPLTEELDRLDLSSRKEDPVEEVKRIQEKKARSRKYAAAHLEDPAAVLDGIEREESADGSSVHYIMIGANRLKQQHEFGRLSGTERREAATAAHKKWIKEARGIWRTNRFLTIGDVAIEVKLNLGLPDAHRTIRRAISPYKP